MFFKIAEEDILQVLLSQFYKDKILKIDKGFLDDIKDIYFKKIDKEFSSFDKKEYNIHNDNIEKSILLCLNFLVKSNLVSRVDLSLRKADEDDFFALTPKGLMLISYISFENFRIDKYLEFCAEIGGISAGISSNDLNELKERIDAAKSSADGASIFSFLGMLS